MIAEYNSCTLTCPCGVSFDNSLIISASDFSKGWRFLAMTDCHPTTVDLHRFIQPPRKVRIMLTPSDIFILILLVGSGILIWIARCSKSTYQNDASITPHHESHPSAGQMGNHGETNSYTSHSQSEKEDAHATERELNRSRNTSLS